MLPCWLDLLKDIIVGVVIGVFTGVTVTRFFIFNQEIQRAKDAVLTMLDRFDGMMDVTDEGIAAGRMTWLIFHPAIAIKAQGHLTQAETLRDYSLELQEKTLVLWKNYRSDLEAAGNDQRLFQNIVDRSVGDVNRLMKEGFQAVSGIKPDMMVIILGRAFALSWRRKTSKLKFTIRIFSDHVASGDPMVEICDRYQKEREANRRPHSEKTR